MAEQKTSTWQFTGFKATVNEKAEKMSDIALYIKADSIIKNGKPTTGKIKNLTVAQWLAYSLKVNETAHTATLTGIESPRGRKQTNGATVSELNEARTKFAAKFAAK